jgi:hypothetical protein
MIACHGVPDMHDCVCLDPNNVFDTFEGRLVLEGYIHRHDLNPEQPWEKKDGILWASLRRVYDKEYKAGCTWMIGQIVLGHKVKDVIQAAGPWWISRESEYLPVLVIS